MIMQQVRCSLPGSVVCIRANINKGLPDGVPSPAEAAQYPPSEIEVLPTSCPAWHRPATFSRKSDPPRAYASCESFHVHKQANHLHGWNQSFFRTGTLSAANPAAPDTIVPQAHTCKTGRAKSRSTIQQSLTSSSPLSISVCHCLAFTSLLIRHNFPLVGNHSAYFSEGKSTANFLKDLKAGLRIQCTSPSN